MRSAPTAVRAVRVPHVPLVPTFDKEWNIEYLSPSDWQVPDADEGAFVTMVTSSAVLCRAFGAPLENPPSFRDAVGGFRAADLGLGGVAEEAFSRLDAAGHDLDVLEAADVRGADAAGLLVAREARLHEPAPVVDHHRLVHQRIRHDD